MRGDNVNQIRLEYRDRIVLSALHTMQREQSTDDPWTGLGSRVWRYRCTCGYSTRSYFTTIDAGLGTVEHQERIFRPTWNDCGTPVLDAINAYEAQEVRDGRGITE